MIWFFAGMSLGAIAGYVLCGVLRKRTVEEEVDARLQEASEHFWERWESRARN